MYRGSVEPVLVSLSDSYSNDNEILVSDNKYSYPAYTNTDYFHPTSYCPKEKCIQFYPKKDVLL